MENDKTIFQNPIVTPSTNPLPVIPNPQISTPAQPEATQPPNPLSESSVVSPLTTSNENNNKRIKFPKNLLKILIGLFVVIIFLFSIIFLILQFWGNKNSSAEVTLNYWGLWEDSKTMQTVIADFERENPSIKVNYSKQDLKQYRETMITRINNGSGADIITYHNTWYPMLSSVLLPFPTNIISGKEFANTFYPVAQKDLIKNGAIYGIPMETDNLVMYVNTDLFKAAGVEFPKTWNDFIDAARTLTVKDENGKIKTAGAAMGTFDNINHAPDIISLLFLQNSVNFKDINSSADRVEGAWNFYTSFANDQNNVWDNTLDPSILAFSKGNLAIYFGYSWDFFDIKKFNPALNLQILQVPQLVNQSNNLASYWASGVSNKSKHQKEALIFLKFLSQKTTEEKLYTQESKERAFGKPYARVDLGDLLKDNSLLYPIILQAKTADSSFFVDSTKDNGMNQELNTYLGNAINAVISGTSVESAFSTFSKGVSQVLNKYGQ